MDLSLNALQAFVQVAERGSIAAAAEAMSFTPSAVSQRLNVLERQLDTVLFERHGNRLALTPEGEALLPEAHAALATLEGFVDSARNRFSLQHLRIGGFPSGLTTVVAPVLPALAEAGIAVTLSTLEDDAGLQELRLGSIDVMFVQSYALNPSEFDDLVRIPVVQEPLVVLSAVPAGTLADRAERNWAIPNDVHVCGHGARTLCRSAGFEPTITGAVDDFTLITALVRHGDMDAILPISAVAAEAEDLIQGPVGDAHRCISAYVRPLREHDDTIAQLLTTIADLPHPA